MGGTILTLVPSAHFSIWRRSLSGTVWPFSSRRFVARPFGQIVVVLDTGQRSCQMQPESAICWPEVALPQFVHQQASLIGIRVTTATEVNLVLPRLSRL